MKTTVMSSKIELMDAAKLIPYARNSRQHSDYQIQQIASSIREFGFTNPILISETDDIIAGHGRLMAANFLGMSEVPCIRLTHLTDQQKKAYVIADNKLALNASWDDELLALELGELKDKNFDLSLTGFNEDELSNLLILETVEGLTDEDDVPEVPEEPVSKQGDIWICGNHRVMCGDSTSIDAVEKLLDGHKANLIFTDPPYNIDYQGVSDKRDKIKNDKMSDDDFVDFLTQSLLGCETMYVCCSWQYSHLFRKAMENLSRSPKAMIVWDKINPAQHLDKYYKQHEIIWYYGDFGGHKTLRGDVWQIKRQKNTVHPTMKPVELIDIAMVDQPDKEIVYDAFGGSGSTMISCEKNHKKARLMELEPNYVDVIVKRWQDFTGKLAVLESTGQTFNRIKT